MKHTHANVVSHTERRTGLRVVSANRNPADMKRFAAAVRTLPCVDKVYTNVRTGSILIEHKGGTRDQFKGVFEDIGSILRSTLSLDLPAGIKEMANLDLARAIEDLDLRTGLMGTPFSFSTLIPLSLGALAFIQLRRQGLQLAGAPWYILAYLAYYTHRKLNKVDKVVEKGAKNSSRERLGNSTTY
jgi:hypothetical protein